MKKELVNLYKLGKKHYSPKELLRVIPSFVVLSVINTIFLGIFYLAIQVLSGQITASSFHLENSFVCLLIVIGALFSAAKLFLREVERFEKDEHCHFSIIRLTKSVRKEEQVRSKINYGKNQQYKNRLTINALEKRAVERQEKFRDYPIYIYVLAGVSALLNWIFRQFKRCFMMFMIYSFFILTLLQFFGWQSADIDAVREFFSDYGFVGLCIIPLLSFFLIVWFIDLISGKRCAISYFWEMLDNQQLKRYGIVPNETTENIQNEKRLLKRLKLQRQATRKNIAK